MSETSPSLLVRLGDPADDASWRKFLEIYRPMIRNWLGRHGVPAGDCDDLMQDVLAVVVRRVPEFEHNSRVGAFRTWLRSITINCLRDSWKSARLKPLPTGGWAEVIESMSDPRNELNRMWDEEHDRHVTRRLMDLIRPSFAEKTWLAFEATALRDEPPQEVADRLGITVNAVFVAKSKVLTRLRQEAAGMIDL